MADVGLRELRQNASEVIRRVEAGESFTVTVNGRAAARLVPTDSPRRHWRGTRDVLRDLSGLDSDPDLASDLRDADSHVAQSLRDPFERSSSDEPV